MVAAGGAEGPERPSGGVARACAVASVILLAAFALADLTARSRASGFVPLESWPLGDHSQGGPFLAWTSLALGVSLGWGVPGLSLAFLTNASLRGPALLARALGLGVGYILLTGLGHAMLVGHAPGRRVLLGLLAGPPLVLLGRAMRRKYNGRADNGLADNGPANGGQRDAVLGWSLLAIVALTVMSWPKLAREGLNGDGTEAYELARSLEAHPVPRWDLERWDGPGRFGTPAVNPFLTNSYLVWAGMAVMGRGELAARLPLVPAVVIAAVVAGGLVPRPRRSGWAYLAAISGLYVLWNAYYVGYEPPFTDLAEPAATDTLMIALWLAGFSEVVRGAEWLGVGSLLLAAGVLYSAPVLTVPALVCLGLQTRRWRPFALWCGGAALAAAAAVAYGAWTGDLRDWIRQVRSEYWYDLVDQARRSATGRFAGQLLLLTGALPLVAVAGWRRLPAASRALLCAAGLYLAIALLSSYKNLHYLAPFPFLLAAPALQASGPWRRAAAVAVVAAAFVLSWPTPAAVHRETVELGQESCIDGMGYEDASLAADVVYDAFARTGQAERFAVGKHTFVRYALDRGGARCVFRLGPAAADGWIAVAGDGVTLATRDPDAYARWRLRPVRAPSAALFPRSPPPELPAAAEAWPGTIVLAEPPGSALVMEDFDPRNTTDPRARLLVPRRAGGRAGARLRVRFPHPAVRLEARVNAGRPAEIDVAPDATVVDLSAAAGWRDGWNVLELRCRPAGLALQALQQAPSP